MGLAKDDKVDAFILINGEQTELDEEWKGHTQTLKLIFSKLLDKLFVSTTKEIAKVSTQLSLDITSTNQKVESIKEDIASNNKEVKLVREDITIVK